MFGVSCADGKIFHIFVIYFIQRKSEQNLNLPKACDYMDWWNISVYGVIPALTVVILFFVKRKLLWIAPLISTVLSFVISIIAMPSILSVNEYRGFLLWAMLMHLGIAIILTAIAYFIAYILKRKQK